MSFAGCTLCRAESPTIRGTILGSCAVTAKAVLENPQAQTQFKHVWELFACGLIYAVTLYGMCKRPRCSRAYWDLLWCLLQLIDWALLPRAALGVLALLCGNGYIVGINQIYDEDIDKVNKPFLPIASG